MKEDIPNPAGLRLVPDSDAGLDREALSDRLFHRIAACTDFDDVQVLRGQIVSINMRVADSLARRYFGRGEASEDLRQVAYVGLIKAVAGFDPGRGANFLSYASPTITGELKKHFRDRCWAIRPPRRVQDLQREIVAARDAMAQDSARPPTTGELAAKLKVPAAYVTEAILAQGCFSPSSLDAQLVGDSAVTLAETMPAEDRELGRIEAHMLLAPLIRVLPERDRQILELRFIEEQTQQQIAQELGTSQIQISRHLARLMAQLRHRLEPGLNCA